MERRAIPLHSIAQEDPTLDPLESRAYHRGSPRVETTQDGGTAEVHRESKPRCLCTVAQPILELVAKPLSLWQRGGLLPLEQWKEGEAPKPERLLYCKVNENWTRTRLLLYLWRDPGGPLAPLGPNPLIHVPPMKMGTSAFPIPKPAMKSSTKSSPQSPHGIPRSPTSSMWSMNR